MTATVLGLEAIDINLEVGDGVAEALSRAELDLTLTRLPCIRHKQNGTFVNTSCK